ncbi:metallophosphoesterase family protein [Chitinophaga sp. MM2321]|uniref:metallophosphoesterase family protein n=1 Tax=Chitinophaga sp. MM2321 TaxID=3137178 RepID=UPI0032D5826B
MTLKRRDFIGHISKAGLLSCLPLSGLKAMDKTVAAANETSNTFLTAPYLQHITPEAVTVMWITAEKCFSWIEISEPGGTPEKVYSARNGLKQAYNRINKIRATGLRPGTTYEYRIFSQEIREFKPYKVTYGDTIQKGPFTFSTPALKEEEVSFVVFNDMHNHPQNITELMGKFAPDKGKDYDFVVYNGDSFNWVDGEEPIIKDLLEPSGNVFSTTHPFLMVQGNHEPRGNYARELFDYFDYPEDRCYYAFTRGPVRFIVMDSGEDKEDTSVEYSGLVSFDDYREEQAKWLEKEINSKAFKQAAFRVVFIHIPVFHSGDWHGTTHCRTLFNPLFNKGKIDIAISGHTHKYGTFDADPATHHYPIVIGGGPGYVGRGGGKRTIIKVKADHKSLSLQMLLDDGTVAGAYNLKKK